MWTYEVTDTSGVVVIRLEGSYSAMLDHYCKTGLDPGCKATLYDPGGKKAARFTCA